MTTNCRKRPRLTGARITAILEDAPVIVEQGLTLVVEEGRYEMITEEDMNTPERFRLVYQCYVNVEGSAVAASWSGTDAQIVITDAHENGTVITIVGAGVIGKENNGATKVSFETAPAMVGIDPSRTEAAEGL